MIFLGIDLGSSSVKVTLFDGENGVTLGDVGWPQDEMPIVSRQAGWAEQDPELWWQHTKTAIGKVCEQTGKKPADIAGIGIAYQMHGLVCVDKAKQTVNLANIWCDSRAVGEGNETFRSMGEAYCFEHLLNSPGNFTAAKLRWLQKHQPEVFARIYKIMLPGDFISLKLSGECTTTTNGLSEGVLWDYQSSQPAWALLDHWGIDHDKLSYAVGCFSQSVTVSAEAAQALGLTQGIPISYRSGDQPNTAFSLNVIEPGELAATGGTSAVLYAVNKDPVADMEQRINTFMHVSRPPKTTTGLLMCLNGGGRAYSWLRSMLASEQQKLSYSELNALAEKAPVGSDGLYCLPFGNGVERITQNKQLGGSFHDLDFNRHDKTHMVRATLEGIAFAMRYGFDHLQKLSCDTRIIRATDGNLFQSALFSQTIANLTRCPVELYNTNGSVGAARGAAVGTGYYADEKEAFSSLKAIKSYMPDPTDGDKLAVCYGKWLEQFKRDMDRLTAG